jgi:hypothetical protein
MIHHAPKTSTLTADRLRQVLEYCPLFGEFRWRKSRPGCVSGKIAGTINSNGYRQIQIDGIFHRASRLAWLYQTGAFPEPSLFIDHINGVRDDDQWCNLRLATPKENARNRRPKDGRKVCGVYQAGNDWTAEIMVDGVCLRLGRFKCEEAAIEARCEAEKHHFGDFARQVKEARHNG